MRKLEIKQPERPNVGAFIKKQRKKFFLTQQEICKKIGISRPTYNKIENDKAEITLLQAKKLADFLNISISDLLVGEDSANRNIRSSLSDTKEEILELDSEEALLRTGEAILYLCSRCMGKYDVVDQSLHQLLFLIEYTYYNMYSSPLFSITFIKKNDSPTIFKFNQIINRLLENQYLEKVISDNFKYPNQKYLTLREFDLKKFNAQELKIIDQIITISTNEGMKKMVKLIKSIEQVLNTKDEGVIPIYPQ